MSTTATIAIRTDKDVKEQAQKLFADLGLDLSTAINIFLRQTLIYRGLPFSVTDHEDFNAETLAAIDEVENHPERLEGPYNTFEELLEALHGDSDD